MTDTQLQLVYVLNKTTDFKETIYLLQVQKNRNNPKFIIIIIITAAAAATATTTTTTTTSTTNYVYLNKIIIKDR